MVVVVVVVRTTVVSAAVVVGGGGGGSVGTWWGKGEATKRRRNYQNIANSRAEILRRGVLSICPTLRSLNKLGEWAGGAGVGLWAVVQQGKDQVHLDRGLVTRGCHAEVGLFVRAGN